MPGKDAKDAALGNNDVCVSQLITTKTFTGAMAMHMGLKSSLTVIGHFLSGAEQHPSDAMQRIAYCVIIENYRRGAQS